MHMVSIMLYETHLVYFVLPEREMSSRFNHCYKLLGEESEPNTNNNNNHKKCKSECKLGLQQLYYFHTKKEL